VIASQLVSRALPMLGPATRQWRHQSELRWVAAVAPRLLSHVEGIPEDGWRTEAVKWTGTSVAVAVVAHQRSTRRLIVKVPAGADGAANLRRQVHVLLALARDPRLQDWRAVVPHPVHQGEVDGKYYCIEEALPGEQGALLLRRGRRAWALLDASAQLIDGLHSRTAQERPLDEAAVEAWVNLPLRRLEQLARAHGRGGELRAGVERLRRELSGSLLNRTVRLSWIHGDYWPGNILASTQSRRITGIVDWDQAAADQLRLHDLLHLHLYARCLRRGEELGEVVIEALRAGVPEAIGVRADRVDAWIDGIPPRASLLLYWLRHVTLFLDSDGHRDNRYWIRTNIENVLLRA
jgi:aminoglycoside phosphotransferase (APT) family kinase protein